MTVSEGGSLDDKVRESFLRILRSEYDGEFRREVTQRLLKNPLDYPEELRGWIPSYVGQSGVQIPISQISGNFLVSDSTSKLGGNIHGRTGMVRAGTAPYDYFQLVYDATEERWVSSFFIIGQQASAQYYNTTSTSPASPDYLTYAIVPLGVFTAAGIKLQVRFGALLTSNNASGVTTAQVQFANLHPGESFTNGIDSSWSITNTGTTAAFRDTGWKDIPSSLDENKQFLVSFMVVKTGDVAHTASMTAGIIWARWVSI